VRRAPNNDNREVSNAGVTTTPSSYYQRIFPLLFIIFILTTSFMFFCGGCIRDEIKGEFQPQEKIIDQASPKVLAFFENGWDSPLHGSSLPSLQKNFPQIDQMSPFWFTVNMDGTIEDNHNQEAMDFAREKNIPVMALFNNEKNVVPSNDTMLTDEALREKSLEGILKAVDKYDYDGVNIDFEIIPPESRDHFTSYIQELSRELQERDVLLDVSVFPRVEVAEDMHGVYDYAALAELVDRVVLMTYNEHYPASNPGPIASKNWVRKNIEDALNHIPAEQLLLGIAVYGYDWPGKAGSPETVEYIPMTEAEERAERKDVEVKWDDQARSPYYSYREKGMERQVWFENAESIEPKLPLVDEYDLSGIAIWRIGFEDGRVWEVIDSYF